MTELVERDNNGKFKKISKLGGNQVEEHHKIEIDIPNFNTVIYYLFIIAILLPWIILIIKSNFFGRAYHFIDKILLDQYLNGVNAGNVGGMGNPNNLPPQQNVL
jgi:hypothetical protein